MLLLGTLWRHPKRRRALDMESVATRRAVESRKRARMRMAPQAKVKQVPDVKLTLTEEEAARFKQR